MDSVQPESRDELFLHYALNYAFKHIEHTSIPHSGRSVICFFVKSRDL